MQQLILALLSNMCVFFADDFQDEVGPAPVKKAKSTTKTKAKTKVQEEAKSKEPASLKRKER